MIPGPVGVVVVVGAHSVREAAIARGVPDTAGQAPGSYSMQ